MGRECRRGRPFVNLEIMNIGSDCKHCEVREETFCSVSPLTIISICILLKYKELTKLRYLRLQIVHDGEFLNQQKQGNLSLLDTTYHFGFRGSEDVSGMYRVGSR